MEFSPRQMLRCAAALLALLCAAALLAHPEDEFCVPGEDSLDPELCRMLAEMDSQDGAYNQSRPILDAEGNERGFGSTLGLYVVIGINHILPGGLDHPDPKQKPLRIQGQIQVTRAHTRNE